MPNTFAHCNKSKKLNFSAAFLFITFLQEIFTTFLTELTFAWDKQVVKILVP
jgi:hypothetical protein